MEITGSCHCGELKYKATVIPEKVGICHCNDCQVLSGSAFRTVVISTADSLVFTKGTPKIYIKIAESGNQRDQSFCGTCASPISASNHGNDPKIHGIRLGTVDQRMKLTPTFQIWCGEAQPWVENFDSIPKISDKGPKA